MKIRFYLATAIVALSWMGCSQEEATNEIISGANTIQATIESSSRSTVTDAGVFSWTAGDQITLVGEESGNVVRDTYTYTGSGDSFEFDNAAASSTSPSVEAPVVAYYPAHDSHNTTTFFLPNSYGDSSTEYVADTHAAMMATPPASGNTYAFMHLGGVMRFNVKNVPVGVNEFRLMIQGKQINGQFSITENNNGEKVIATKDVTSDVSTECYVQILFKTLEDTKDMTFYVPMPTGTYGDYQVALNKGGTYIECESTSVTNTINRKTLLLMPTFTYDSTEGKLVKGEATVGVIDLEDGSKDAEIEADAEVVVTPGTDADATATLNYTPANDGSSVLSLSDGSGATESGDSEGKVVVSTASGSTVASCEINTPSLTVELSAADGGTATFEEVTALTAEQTLIIGKGVTVTTLNIKGGNVVIEEGATVTTIKNEAGNNTITVNDEAGLKAAIAAGGTTTLARNIELTSPVYFSYNKNITSTLDLNSYKISITGTTNVYGILAYGGTLTIKGEGTIDATQTAVCAYGATVNIEGGNYVGGYDGSATIYAYLGTINISGGTFEAKDMSSGMKQYSVLNCKDGKATIVVTGGKYKNFNPANNKSESSSGGTNFVAEGYSSVADGDYYVVSEN